MTELPSQFATASGQREHLWLVALYETEERIHELLARLRALGVETEDASILRVELNDQIRAPLPTAKPATTPLAPRLRNAISGAIVGSAILLLFGLGLYEAGLLNLAPLRGLPAHAVLFVSVGALFGALVGAALKPIPPQQPPAPVPASVMPELASDGYLVAVKMPPHLGEQAETIARGLGAKQILL